MAFKRSGVRSPSSPPNRTMEADALSIGFFNMRILTGNSRKGENGHKKRDKLSAYLICAIGATGVIRTLDPRLRRPLLYPTELQTHKMVGAAGFEPATLWSQTRCATKLRYAPSITKYIIHICKCAVKFSQEIFGLQIFPVK